MLAIRSASFTMDGHAESLGTPGKNKKSAALQGPRCAAPHADLPLDIRATAFQRRVWEELRRIPVGETRSYAEVAAAIGSPAAVRAVGNACANNPVAIAIPCHRVMRNDGKIGGYAWGIKRKQALIAAEKSRSDNSGSRARKKA